MTHSLPHRMLAVPARLLLALFTDPVAMIADIAFWLALFFTFWALWLLIVCTERWIARHVQGDALDREYIELCDAFWADEPTDAEFLPGVTRIGPTTPPPVRRALKHRRMPGVRILRRQPRRTTTSSSSDRRFR